MLPLRFRRLSGDVELFSKGVDQVADGLDLLHVLVLDFQLDAGFGLGQFLDGHANLDDVKGIGVEVVDDRGGKCDLVGCLGELLRYGGLDDEVKDLRLGCDCHSLVLLGPVFGRTESDKALVGVSLVAR